MPNKISCGIDFGTSNSTVAIAHEGAIELIPLENNKTTLPSALFFGETTGILYGRKAIDAYLDGEEGRLLRGIKKIIGTSLMDDKTLINSRPTSFLDILAIYLKHLKKEAEQHANQTIENVVIGRPVHFHDNNSVASTQAQESLEDIAKSIGFKNVLFQYEPIAAAFAHETRIKGEKLALVMDLGGGTSDFTVIRLSQSNVNKSNRTEDVLATSGVKVGGTTFDQRISMKFLMSPLGLNSRYRDAFDSQKLYDMPLSVYSDLSDWSRIYRAHSSKSIRQTISLKARALEPDKLEHLLSIQEKQLGYSLLEEAEKAKIDLSDNPATTVTFQPLGTDFKVTVQREIFDRIIEDDIRKIKTTMEECLTKATIQKDQIDMVIMTGGSTELPSIKAFVREQFPDAELSDDHKMDSVGTGLAQYAQHAFSS